MTAAVWNSQLLNQWFRKFWSEPFEEQQIWIIFFERTQLSIALKHRHQGFQALSAKLAKLKIWNCANFRTDNFEKKNQKKKVQIKLTNFKRKIQTIQTLENEPEIIGMNETK